MSEIRFESYYGVSELGGSSLTHSGIMGMKWGRRRYQNSDGSLTPLGREHYGVGPPRGSKEKKTWQERREERKQARADRLQARAEKRQAKEEAKAAKEKAERLKVINTGDTKKINKIYSKLTDDEITEAIYRIDAKKKLRKLQEEANVKPLKLSKEDQQRKEQIMARGNPVEIRYNMRLFTNDELADALTRATFNTKLKNIHSDAKKQSGDMFDKVSKIAKTVGTVAGAVAAVKNLSNKKDEGGKKEGGGKKDGGKKEESAADVVAAAAEVVSKVAAEKATKSDGSKSVDRTTEALEELKEAIKPSAAEKTPTSWEETYGKKLSELAEEYEREEKRKGVYGGFHFRWPD